MSNIISNEIIINIFKISISNYPHSSRVIRIIYSIMLCEQFVSFIFYAILAYTVVCSITNIFYDLIIFFSCIHTSIFLFAFQKFNTLTEMLALSLLNRSMHQLVLIQFYHFYVPVFNF